MSKELQARLAKQPKKKPCPDGAHTEIIQYPTVPDDENDPQARVAAMQASGANAHEIAAAQHDIAAGDITHGSQLSRSLTPEEKEAGHNGESQKIKAICVECRKTREIDQAPDEKTIVEAKDEDRISDKTRRQAQNNATFSKRPGNEAVMKLPANQVEGGWGPSSRPAAIIRIFQEAGARAPTFIPI